MANPTAILLAGGRGERMRSALPKTLHHVAGAPMLRHVACAAAHAAPDGLLVVVSPASKEGVAAVLGPGVRLVEQPEPLGAGNALALALDEVSFGAQRVLLINGVQPLLRGETLAALDALHEERGATVAVLTAMLPAAEAEHLGRLRRGARGKPIAIVEAADLDRAALHEQGAVEVNVGAYAFDALWLRRSVAKLKPHEGTGYHATDLVALAVAEGRRVEALVADDPDEAIGVKTRATLARAEAAMQRRLRAYWMDNGVTMLDPATTFIDADVRLEPDVTLHPNTALRGRTRVGAWSAVGPNATLTDADVAERCDVGASTLTGATLEPGARVGPYCHVRDGACLEQDAYVGSHAEIKASRIGRGARVGHFSYVGDADVGAGVNVGAGAVTCNFDGLAKHRTIIEEGAFIGSGCMLVAPVRVGAGAVTGAGAVITRDVEPGARVAGVPARAMRRAQAALER